MTEENDLPADETPRKGAPRKGAETVEEQDGGTGRAGQRNWVKEVGGSKGDGHGWARGGGGKRRGPYRVDPQ